MAVFGAFASSLRRRAAFVDHFRHLAGRSDLVLPVLADLLTEDKVDEWILDPLHDEVAAILSRASDPLLTTLVNQTQEWARKLNDRLAEKPVSFGDVKSTRALSCDAHRSGISVAIEFEGGTYVYKPRSVALDSLFSRFIDSLRAMGATSLPSAAEVVDLGEYGYVRFKTPRSQPIRLNPPEIRCIGSTLALVYLLAGVDFHYENIVFSVNGETTLIDLECLLQPQLEGTVEDGRNALSILETGILPTRLAVGEQLAFDPSIVGSSFYDVGPSLTIVARELLGGFEDTYEFVARRRHAIAQELMNFEGLSSRFIASNTVDYYRALAWYIHEDALNRGQEFVDAITSSSERFHSLVAHEKRCLKTLCIPIFYVDTASRSIVDEDGCITGLKIRFSGLEKATDRLLVQMGESDLSRQLWFISLSVELNARLSCSDLEDMTPPYLEIDRSASSILASASSEFEKLKSYLKLGEERRHTLVVPVPGDVAPSLQTRQMTEVEWSIFGALPSLLNDCALGQADASRLGHCIREVLLTSADEALFDNLSPHKADFLVSAHTGPCSEVLRAALPGADGIDRAMADIFIAQFNEAVRDRRFLYLGGLRTRCLSFANGLPCLILTLLVLSSLAHQIDLDS